MRHAVRQLFKSPGFTAIAVLTLALCIGANSAIFSVVQAILLKPYPWPDSSRLVGVFNAYPRAGLQDAGTSVPDYLDRRTGVSGFADAALYHWTSLNLGGTGEPARVVGLLATPSLFTTLQTGAALGRVFTDDEATPGRDKVVVLSHALWQNRFAGDTTIIGRTIRLNAEPFTVIGVMPDGFYFPNPRVQVWIPFAFTPEQRSDSERGHEFSEMIARLKRGASTAAIQRELDAIQVRNAARLPENAAFWKTSGFGAHFESFLDQNVGHVRGMLWLVQAGVAAALLIGCANVANLLLTRAVARERELAIRSALGAGRARLARMLVAESVVLFLVGGAFGLLLALWGVNGLQAAGLSTLPRASGVQLDATVFGFTLGCALAAGLFFGSLPAWSVARGNAAAALKETGARTTAGRRTHRIRAALVVGEIALAVMLLSTAGLLVKSFMRLREQHTGFSPGGVLTAQVDLPAARYDRPEKLVAFCDAAMAAIRALPGVQDAGLTTVLPFTGNNSQGSYTSPEITIAPGAPTPHANLRNVDPGYLHALGLTLLRGRWIAPEDSLSAPHVVVIDRLAADRYWPGQDPVGKHVNRDIGSTDTADLWTIVGVVAPIKSRGLDDEMKKETIYFPLAQQPDTDLVLVVRTGGDPVALTGALRTAIRQVDTEQPIYDVKTMVEHIDDSAQPRRAPAMLLSLFSGIALLLAALGVYGVLAFSVAQRTSEFGVRLALGAMPRDLVRLVLRQATGLVLLGVAVGLGGYFAISRLLASLLFDVSTADPQTLVAAPLVLVLVAFVACLLPVHRATRVDPLQSLRAE